MFSRKVKGKYEKSNLTEFYKSISKVFFPLFVLTSILTIIILFVSEKTDIHYQLINERHEIKEHSSNTNSDIREVSSDLMLLSNFYKVSSLWAKESILQEDLYEVELDFLQLSIHKKLYDQVRLLDLHGNEVVRVNFNNNAPYIVQRKNLQSKSDRYYFKESIILNEGEIYISPLDLNIEFGEIETPPKPMMRFATPVFDNNGVKQGLVVLNYFGPTILNNFKKQIGLNLPNKPMLLNSDGYWLQSDNPELAWGFMYPDKNNLTFRFTYPEAWQTINSSAEGQFETKEGIFTFATIYPLLVGQKVGGNNEAVDMLKLVNTDVMDYYWKTVSFIPTSTLYYQRNQRRILAAIIYTLLILLFLVGSFFTSLNIIRVKTSEAENRKLYTAIQQSPATISIVNLKGDLEFVNPKFEEVTGYSKEEVLGQNPRIFQSGHHNKEFYVDLWDSLSKGKTWRGEFLNKRKDGEQFWEAASISPIFKKGSISSYMKVAEDVTLRKNAEEELKIGKTRLQMLNRIIRHDLANDFTVIKSAVRIFKATSDDKMISEIEKRTVKSLQTISNYKEYETFIDSNTGLDSVDLLAVLNELQKEMTDLNISISGESIVYADGALNSLFKNLLLNSVKHGNANKIDIEITSEDTICTIKFKDNGTGIPNEVKPHIFDEGYIFGNSGNTGIGLYIVHQTIQRYGGSINVYDNTPRGTVFSITLNKALRS